MAMKNTLAYYRITVLAAESFIIHAFLQTKVSMGWPSYYFRHLGFFHFYDLENVLCHLNGVSSIFCRI
jgi:hypothetical protein